MQGSKKIHAWAQMKVPLLSKKNSACTSVQRMLKIRRVYTLAEILSQIFVKKRKKIGDLIHDHGLTN